MNKSYESNETLNKNLSKKSEIVANECILFKIYFFI